MIGFVSGKALWCYEILLGMSSGDVAMRTCRRLIPIEAKSSSRPREKGANMSDIKEIHLIRPSERLEESTKGMIVLFSTWVTR